MWVCPCRWFEQDPEHLYQTVVRCVEGVCQRLGAEDLARVRGVGITNQRETTILWDRTTGRCLHNAIVWCDRRTGGVASKLISSKGKDGLRVSGGVQGTAVNLFQIGSS